MSVRPKKTPAAGGDATSATVAAHSVTEIPSAVWLRVLGFFSGGSVMVVEFTGNRLLAPGFGNSLYTWTALIGVILLALSCGDYLGGWLVDRKPSVALLPILFVLSGLLTGAIPVLAPLLPDFSTMDLIGGPIKVSLALFFLPGLVLASITPVSIRLLSKALADANIGKSAGTVGMASALGSFVGTMATSYVLIPVFGVREILLFLAAMLLVLGVVLAAIWRRQLSGFGSVGTLTVLAATVVWAGTRKPAADGNVMFEHDTFYHRINVSHMPSSDGGEMRLLKLDSTYEGAQKVGSGEIVFEYQQYWRLSEIFTPDVKRALFLGAGAFGMPEQLSARFPQANVDVVEIDPAVIDVGRKYFRLDDYPRVHAHAADARRFLRRAPEKYDFIFGDAYNGVQYVPAHLVTREFFAELAGKLTDRGVFVINVIGSIEGPRSDFIWRVMNSMRPAFPHLQVYAVNNNPYVTQNLLILGTREDPAVAIADFLNGPNRNAVALHTLLNTRVELPASSRNRELFTDNHNPVEYVVARQLRE